MLLVPYAIARVFVLDLNSALCGSNWKGPPLIADVKSPLSPTTGVLSRNRLVYIKYPISPVRSIL